MILLRMLDYSYQKSFLGRTPEQWREFALRLLARYLVAPFTRAFNFYAHVLGVAFVLRFGLEVAGSARLLNGNLGQLTRLISDPFLSSIWLWMAGFRDISADTFHAVPMVLAIAVWVARPTLADRLVWLADHLDGRSLDKLFRERDVRPALRWKSRMRRTEEFLETEYESREQREARAAQRAAAPPVSAPVVSRSDSGEHRLAPIGFDSETRIQIIGRYELLQELSRGPMGVVYKAYDLQIGRPVVLKLLDKGGMDAEEIHLKKQRLLTEARAAGKLVHAGLVAVFDVSEDERGNPYIVLEHVEGETLEAALCAAQGSAPGQGRAPLNLTERLDVAIEITQAVEYAHRHGVIHRDLKPANVLLTPDLHAKIVDFGIARLMEWKPEPPRASRFWPAAPSSMDDDGVPGTPEFVAPELLRGMAAGRSSDIFSLGVMLYWIFTGELPFSGRSVTEITYNVAHTNPSSVLQRNWALPAELDAVLQRCLAKDPVARYSSAGALAAELQALRYAQAAQQAAQQPPRAKAG
jgi:tRNA A-37 threonylcarbamoyl transferase component Bud32